MDKRQTDFFNAQMERMNFTKLKDSIENIDKKLSVLLKHMDYDEYLSFIKSNKMLKNFDDVLGLFQNNMIYTESMVNSLPEEYLKEIDNYVLKKIKDLGLEHELKNIDWE